MHVYETTHPVAHSAEEMFALVARVEDYPKFLPLCEALRSSAASSGTARRC